MTTPHPARTSANATGGPKTPAGKAVSARNATTHGLFCRQTVLPHLGEDPAGYKKLLDTLHEQLRPRNLMERQYLELWADASWKLRRLSRLEAQVWEDDRLDEDARLIKLERLARLQTGLRRQLDRAVRMLSQDVPNLFAHRTREDVVEKLYLTENQCAENPYREQDVERAVQANRHWPPPAADFTDGLDNTALPPPPPPPLSGSEGSDSPVIEDEEAISAPAEARENKICQNEPILAPNHPLPPALADPEGGEVVGLGEPEGPPASAWQGELQELEDLLNSGTLTKEERRSLLMREDIPGFSLSAGRITIHR